jgi:hypothetical protein
LTAAAAPLLLPPESAAARRRCCLRTLRMVTRYDVDASEALFLTGACFGAIMRAGGESGTVREGARVFSPADLQNGDYSAALDMLFNNFSVRVEGDKRRPEEWVPSCPYLGPLWRRKSCATCGLLPGAVTAKPFQACSLCLDPAVGRFCCKEPCFAAFWRGGHKKECAGRDKLKKNKGEGK